MTMHASTAARGRRQARLSSAFTLRATAFGLLASCSGLAAADGGVAGATVGIGLGSFDGAGDFDRRGHALDVRAGWALRERLSVELGVVGNRSDIDYSPIHGPRDLVQHEWRALHAGGRWTMPLSERWHVGAGLALAHVSNEREQLQGEITLDGVELLRHVGTRRSSSWGWLAGIALGFDPTPNQRVAIEYRRLHAGIGERCENGVGYIDCSHPAYVSVDGPAVSWNYRFR